jgi:hypothetical protein
LKKAAKFAASKPEYLSGWKEIASYMGKGVRTVQRYEREMGLPIHRHPGQVVGAVLVIRSELDRWVAHMPTKSDVEPRLRATFRRSNTVGANFLQIDTEIGLTFSTIAVETNDLEKRKRTTRTARRAYDTITRLRKQIELSDAEGAKLDGTLLRLKSNLQKLGESL